MCRKYDCNHDVKIVQSFMKVAASFSVVFFISLSVGQYEYDAVDRHSNVTDNGQA